MTAPYRFKSPRNGRYKHYCGECKHWTFDERVSGGCGFYGFCDYEPLPDRRVAMHYATSLSKDQYEGACQLFEKRAK